MKTEDKTGQFNRRTLLAGSIGCMVASLLPWGGYGAAPPVAHGRGGALGGGAAAADAFVASFEQQFGSARRPSERPNERTTERASEE